MTEQLPPSVDDLQAEIKRLNKIIQSLMNHAERNTSIKGSEFTLFQTAIMLEDQVKGRTTELEAALKENEKMNRALRQSENNQRVLIENAPVSIHEIDMDGRIISINKAGLSMNGLTEEGAILGSPYLDHVSVSDRDRVAGLLEKAYAGETSHFEYDAVIMSGKTFKSCFVPILNNQSSVTKIMGITEDITERKKAEQQIHHFAFNDALTQLPNRRLLHDRLRLAIAATLRSGMHGAVMFLDLDNFKPLNDTHGHEAGDLLLIEVAHRLTACLRSTDTVARIGGDEFVVLLSELHMDMSLSTEQALRVAEKIRASLARPYILKCDQEGRAVTMEHHCTASIGLTLFGTNERCEEQILKAADKAMYRAKETGRNRVYLSEVINRSEQ
ncbi:diguanylate cyclase domain-containing protein [Amphritea pacifica]|uniref:Diguanylate cyclase n=2 Tax=Amphritea pacifica TaxID=2811233 RepID=A0ABS2WD65_9GAMM|nr:diguanylate cyclase [Amphritea pacifica]MBN0989302.1 diguanylate cyclase [Amphritea pacifica]